VRAPDVVETARLRLRRPQTSDAESIFVRYASDAEVTAFLSWPRHRSVQDTRAFLEASDAEWQRWPAGPYLIEDRERRLLLGSTGFAFERARCAVTGYVLARDAWGRGYATEALGALVGLAPALGLRRLEALCHAQHAASGRVLEKCGFEKEALLPRHSELPNLGAGACDMLRYVRVMLA
jgi:[ribosomal protein S5]-alanine N-acetyltransferase